MKKNFVRIVAALLVAMLALTLVPMGALAATLELYEDIYHSQTPTADDWANYCPLDPSKTNDTPDKIIPHPITIKTTDYENLIWHYGKLYEFMGFIEGKDIGTGDDPLIFKSSITFDGKTNMWVYAGYALHTHDLSYWYSDGTTHWRECLECEENFLYQNWCQDGDEDGICNICGGDVPYHDIKVIEVEGAKITLNRDNASHRTKITADVEAEAGYKVGKLHFVKVRDDGSKQEITRYKKNGQFWTYMPTYEMEVSVDVTKTK